MKKLYLIHNKRTDLISAIREKLKNADIIETEIGNIDKISLNHNDMMVFIEGDKNIISKYMGKSEIVNIHPSLLPSFDNITAIQDAYTSGVKVTGVTIHKPKKNNFAGQIIAQYPILIDSYTNFPQLVDEIKTLELKLAPLAVKSVFEDKVFDIVDFLNEPKHSCGNCKQCGGCTH